MTQPKTKLEYIIENQRLHEINGQLLTVLERFVAKWPAGRVSEETLRLARTAIAEAKGEPN
jgi:hypothetical protein